jgi:hypothetical protein
MALCKITQVQEKKSLFTNLAGLSLRRIRKGLVVPTPTDESDEDPGDTYKALIDTVLAHFRPSVNKTSERHKFRQLKQQEGESVTAFRASL